MTTHRNYSRTELESLLRAERTTVTQRMVVLKGEIRQRVTELEQHQRRLDDIDQAETTLADQGEACSR